MTITFDREMFLSGFFQTPICPAFGIEWIGIDSQFFYCHFVLEISWNALNIVIPETELNPSHDVSNICKLQVCIGLLSSVRMCRSLLTLSKWWHLLRQQYVQRNQFPEFLLCGETGAALALAGQVVQPWLRMMLQLSWSGRKACMVLCDLS